MGESPKNRKDKSKDVCSCKLDNYRQIAHKEVVLVIRCCITKDHKLSSLSNTHYVTVSVGKKCGHGGTGSWHNKRLQEQISH